MGSAPPDYTVFALSVAGAIIILLLGVVGWLLRARVQARERYEALLEKRLTAGAETMGTLRDQISNLGNQFIQELAKMLTQEAFDSYCRSHEVEHNTLDRRLDDL